MQKKSENVFKLGNRVGDQSGFGQVFEAVRIVNGVEQEEAYVVKKLIQLDDDSIARFKREVRYLTKLDHPRIVKTQGNHLGKEPYFYSMLKYQSSLQSLMPQLSVDYKRLRLIFNNILEGLEYLHNEGYYHRDLKPANILYNSDSDLVLCDLGLCIDINSDDSSRLTLTHMGAGTRYYTSPEQQTDLKSVDLRTDIYSIGKMIYEAFTGNRPMPLDIVSLPPAIQYVVKKCTRQRRVERFKTVEELRRHFNMAMDLLINEPSNSDLLSIINKVNSFDELDDFSSENENIVIDLARLLGELKEDEQLQEMVMKVSGKTFNLLEDKHPDLFIQLLMEFINSINSQGWPFSYTDTIANKYEEIFNNVTDIDSKGEILKGLLLLGTSHNRWYVMQKFITLLAQIKNETEAYSIYHILSNEEYDLRRVNNAISINENDLHMVIRRLFVK